MSAEYFISLLKINDQPITGLTLDKMIESVVTNWISFFSNLEFIDSVKTKFPCFSTKINYLESLIFFYANQIEKSVEFVFSSGNFFDINLRSLFNDVIITKIIDLYSLYFSSKGLSQTQREFVLQNLAQFEEIITKVLNKSSTSIKYSDYKIIIGLSIQLKKLEYLKNILSQIPDKHLEIYYKFTNNLAKQNQDFQKIQEIFMNELSSRPSTNYLLLAQCLFQLNLYQKQAEIITQLFQQQQIEGCYQLAIEIYSYGCFEYCQQVYQEINKKASDSKLNSLLLGQWQGFIYNQLIQQNNLSDKEILKRCLGKLNSKESMLIAGVISMYAIAQQHTNDFQLLKEASQELGQIKYGSLFQVASALGLFANTSSQFKEELTQLKINQTDDNTKGGILLAEGLQQCQKKLSDENRQRLLDNLKLNNEQVICGTVLNLGLRYAFSNDGPLTWELKKLIFSEKAIEGQAAGLAIGLINCSNFNQELFDELINSCRNNPHDKISFGCLIGLPLMFLNSIIGQKEFQKIYQALIQETDYLLRLCAIYSVGLYYYKTSNAWAINELLKLTATDLSNDVRRSAVLSLGLVLYENKQKAGVLLKMLSTSYNHYIRHAVGLTLGFVFHGSFNKNITKILRKLLEDKTDYVRQAAGIGLGFVYQLCNDQLSSNFVEARQLLEEKIQKKTERMISKLGYFLGIGLMQSGGGNCMLDLSLPESVVGLYYFLNYWYWYPLINFIGLSLHPSFMIFINKDLRIPRSIYLESNKPTKYFESYRNLQQKDDQHKIVQPVVLSTMRKAKARAKDTTEIESQKSDQQKMIIESQSEQKQEDFKINEENQLPKGKTVLNNPIRMISKQLKEVEFGNLGQRYESVFKGKQLGFILVKDKSPSEQEVYMDDLPKEQWFIPPNEFRFEENK